MIKDRSILTGVINSNVSLCVCACVLQTLPLISQSRRLVREGAVLELMDFSLKDTERSVYIHLFNDYLLLSIQKE